MGKAVDSRKRTKRTASEFGNQVVKINKLRAAMKLGRQAALGPLPRREHQKVLKTVGTSSAWGTGYGSDAEAEPRKALSPRRA